VKVKQRVTIDRIFSEQLFKATLLRMFEEIVLKNRAVKLTINVSNFSYQQQKTLSLIDLDEDISDNKLSVEIQKLRDRFGLDIIKTGNEL
jgi:DNA polymerase-4